MPNYPAQIELSPLASPPQGAVTVPGSKSITNRALVLAALASRNTSCKLTGALRSEDTEVMLECLGKLGFSIAADWERKVLTVNKHDSSRIVPAESAELFVGNSGTTIRFLAAMLSLAEGRYRLDGIPRMRERPIQDLLDALNQIPGVSATSEAGSGCPPVMMDSRGWPKSVPLSLSVRAGVSSQFLSGLLLAAGFAPQSTHVSIEGEAVSEPYIAMTVRMLQKWNRTVTAERNTFTVNPAGEAIAEYDIEPDASAASYFWAAAAVTGGRITVNGLNRESLQGDVGFVNLLERMGCRVESCEAGITVHGRPLHGIDADMNAISDTVMTLAVLACFAEGSTTIRNVAHIRHKETDRISALAAELRKLGAEVDERDDGLTIHPRPLKGTRIATYNDHRMAMSFAIAGLVVPGVVVENPGCVAKTYPEFWSDWAALG